MNFLKEVKFLFILNSYLDTGCYHLINRTTAVKTTFNSTYEISTLRMNSSTTMDNVTESSAEWYVSVSSDTTIKLKPHIGWLYLFYCQLPIFLYQYSNVYIYQLIQYTSVFYNKTESA